MALACDESGSIFVTEYERSRVRRYWRKYWTWRNEVIAGFHKGGDEPASAIGSGLSYPEALTYAPGIGLLIADSGNQRILVWKDGECHWFAGSGVAGFQVDGFPADTFHFDIPTGIAPLSAGEFAVADGRSIRYLKLGEEQPDIPEPIAATPTPAPTITPTPPPYQSASEWIAAATYRISTMGGEMRVLPMDADRDGDMDILIANSGTADFDPAYQIMEQTAPATFSEPRPLLGRDWKPGRISNIQIFQEMENTFIVTEPPYLFSYPKFRIFDLDAMRYVAGHAVTPLVPDLDVTRTCLHLPFTVLKPEESHLKCPSPSTIISYIIVGLTELGDSPVPNFSTTLKQFEFYPGRIIQYSNRSATLNSSYIDAISTNYSVLSIANVEGRIFALVEEFVSITPDLYQCLGGGDYTQYLSRTLLLEWDIDNQTLNANSALAQWERGDRMLRFGLRCEWRRSEGIDRPRRRTSDRL